MSPFLTVRFMRVLKGLEYSSKLELRFIRSLKTESKFLNYIQGLKRIINDTKKVS